MKHNRPHCPFTAYLTLQLTTVKWLDKRTLWRPLQRYWLLYEHSVVNQLMEWLFNPEEMEVVVEYAVFNKFPEETRITLEAQIKLLRRIHGNPARLRGNDLFV